MGKVVRIMIVVFCLLSASVLSFAKDEQQLVGQTSISEKSDSPAVENPENSINDLGLVAQLQVLLFVQQLVRLDPPAAAEQQRQVVRVVRVAVS